MRRLHPALLVHTSQLAGRRQLIAQASAALPPLIIRHPLALVALTSLPSEFDREAATAAWEDAGVPAGAHDQLWEALSEAGLFTDASADPGSWWDDLGWREARTYHEATRDYPFVQMDSQGSFAVDGGRMDDYRSDSPPPSPYLETPDRGAIALPGLAPNQSPDAWLFGMDEPARHGLEGLGLLLDVCFGERALLRAAGDATCVLKSIPSGGARHPTEVYIAVFEIGGIEPGVYRYGVERHRLERVRDGHYRQDFADATLDLFSKYDAPPAAAFVFTSLVERAMWRYRDPRSFRAVLVDVGHAVMAHRHVARMLGYRSYALQKMRDSAVAELIEVDRFRQPPLYVASLVP